MFVVSQIGLHYQVKFADLAIKGFILYELSVMIN
jgi:hypothetical protein